jgi:anti-anti-sigma factor
VNYIDSSGLFHLISAFTSVRKENGELNLLNLKKNIHDLMQITKLDTISPSSKSWMTRRWRFARLISQLG